VLKDYFHDEIKFIYHCMFIVHW